MINKFSSLAVTACKQGRSGASCLEHLCQLHMIVDCARLNSSKGYGTVQPEKSMEFVNKIPWLKKQRSNPFTECGWSHRLVWPRTEPSQGSDTGSNPVGTTTPS